MEGNICCRTGGYGEGFISKGDNDIVNNIVADLRPEQRHRGYIVFPYGEITRVTNRTQHPLQPPQRPGPLLPRPSRQPARRTAPTARCPGRPQHLLLHGGRPLGGRTSQDAASAGQRKHSRRGRPAVRGHRQRRLPLPARLAGRRSWESSRWTRRRRASCRPIASDSWADGSPRGSARPGKYFAGQLR